MDKQSPNRRLLDIESEIKQCQGELAGLSHIIDEVEGDLGRFSLDDLTDHGDAPSKRRSDQQPKNSNHDQTITHYNRLMTKLHILNTQAISHPIHRLPLELLEHIFHLLVEIQFPFHDAWQYEFPLNLTQVCSQWESIVSSVRNRRLWSTVRIDPANPDWFERLNLYLFLSRDEGLNIHITEVTQSIVDALTGHHRRISLLYSLPMSQICDATTSDPDIIQVVIADRSGKQSFSIALSSSVTALPFVALGKGSLRRLQSFFQLQELEIELQAPQLLELGGPLQLPTLQGLSLLTFENPLDCLRIFALSQLVSLRLWLLGSLSPAVYYELETFIIQHMPNLRWVTLGALNSIDSLFLQPVEESTIQSSSATQNESLRRIDCIAPSKIPLFERLITSATHLEEIHLFTPMKSFPCFSHNIRKLVLNFKYSPMLPVVNGGLFKLAYLEALKLVFITAEQLQLLTLFQAPSLLSLVVSYKDEEDTYDHSIPVDAILTFISTSQGIHDMRVDLGSTVGGRGLSLPELQNLKISCRSHLFLNASFDVPKLQHLFLKINDGCGEDESIAGGEDLAEDPIGIASPPPAREAVGSSDVLDMVNTTQILEIGDEEQKRNILEEDDNEAGMDRFKDTDLREAPSDSVVTRAPTSPAVTFRHLKDFEFEELGLGVLPYFPDMLTAFPALERVTLPAVSFNNTPYIDQLVKKISENPALYPNLQEIRTRDYPIEWLDLLKFLRDRKRASIPPNPALRPIRALHFPITPHGSIVEELQDAMLGKVSIRSFPALCPWPLMNSTFVHKASPLGEETQVDSGEETRSQVQDGDARTAAPRVPAQEEFIIGNDDKERQTEAGSGCGEIEDEALSCFFCHKAGLGAGCLRVQKRRVLSRMEVSSGDVRCLRWNEGMYYEREYFEVICVP